MIGSARLGRAARNGSSDPAERAGGAAAGTPGGYAHPAPSSQLVADSLVGTGRYGSATGGDIDLATSYALCRRLAAAHGRTYYFATRFLPAAKRPHVHALYAFARYADDLVDHCGLDWTPQQRRRALESWSAGFLTSLDSGRTDEPVLVAVLDTVNRLGIRSDDLRAFLRSMAMDLEVTRYSTYAELEAYMHGSAAVIGSMMLPILGSDHPQSRDRAMDLGVAFQLTNFLRDIAEDHGRGRIYLPLEDLDRFGVSEGDIAARRVTPAFRRLLAFQIARTRALYRAAEAGWAMLAPSSRTCIRIAHRLYEEILHRIELADYDVFAVRAAVPAQRKAYLAVREVLRPSRPEPVPGPTPGSN